MKIAFDIGPVFSPSKNGIPSYSLNLATALSQRISGSDELLSLTETSHFLANFEQETASINQLLRPGVELRAAMPGSFEAFAGLSWIPLVQGRACASLAGRVWNSLALRSRAHPIRSFRNRFVKEFNRADLDVLHVTSLGGRRTGINRLRARTRCITLHDAFHLIEPEWFTADMVKMLDDTFDLATSYQAIFTVSNASRNDLVSRAGFSADRVHVIPNGIDPAFAPAPTAAVERAQKKFGIRSPYLLAVGIVEPRKNLRTLASAFKVLGPNYKDVQLILVGADGWRVSEAWSGDDRESIVRIGQVPLNDLVCLYTGASAFCFPSLCEGFGLPVLEAMACGCPVIASNTSSLPEVAGGAAILVPPRDIDAWTSAIRQILDDDDLRQAMRRRGYERAKAFSWSKSADMYLEHYRALANSGTEPRPDVETRQEATMAGPAFR
jgi:glycosyltransferase involved in cell wall biosynthesis